MKTNLTTCAAAEQAEQRNAALVEPGVIVQRQPIASFAQGAAAFNGTFIGRCIEHQFEYYRLGRQGFDGIVVQKSRVRVQESGVATQGAVHAKLGVGGADKGGGPCPVMQ